jgi:creatinine amidohydrolase/Fe(II)-dependent formamide hydrolase-like protein
MFCFLTGFLFFYHLTNGQIYRVQDMTTSQLDSLDKEKTIVLLPGGILEEHGPYLPSFTDGYMNLALADSIAKEITKRPGLKVLIFPLIPLGNSGANDIPRKYTFPGTFAIRQTTLRNVLMDLASEIGDQGYKNIFVIHMHGGPNHNQAIDQASEYFTDIYKGRMVNIWNLAVRVSIAVLDSNQRNEDGFSVHAGIMEHSLLFYLQPQFQTSAYKTAKPQKAAGRADLTIVAGKKDWPGYWGAPHMASIELGNKAWTKWTNGILSQINKILDNAYDFTQPTYYQMMSLVPEQKAVNEDAIKHEQNKEVKQREWLKKKD